MRSSSPSDFEASLRALIAPDPDGDIVDWLERNVKSVPYSPNPGPFRIESTPYLAPILRALQDPEVETVAVMGNVQSGKSMVVELWSAFVPARTPGPMLLLQDVDLNAQDWQQTRLRPLWEATPSTRDQISQTEKSKWHMTPFRRNTTWVLGADNERNLQRRSIRFLGGDEVWQWPRGHLKQALARRTAFTWQGKSVFVSQGAEEDHDFTELFNGTDRREWCFTCHKCGEVQPYDWAYIRYPDGAKKDGLWDFDEVRANTTYACRRCDHRHLDRNSVRAEMNATAKYVPMNPGAPKGRVGFHFNALAMQWGLSWGDLAVECIEAAQSFDLHADESKRKDFKMKRLALPWSDEPDDSGAEILPSSYRMEQDWAEEGRAIDGVLARAAPWPTLVPAQVHGRGRSAERVLLRHPILVVGRKEPPNPLDVCGHMGGASPRAAEAGGGRPVRVRGLGRRTQRGRGLREVRHLRMAGHEGLRRDGLPVARSDPRGRQDSLPPLQARQGRPSRQKVVPPSPVLQPCPQGRPGPHPKKGRPHLSRGLRGRVQAADDIRAPHPIRDRPAHLGSGRRACEPPVGLRGHRLATSDDGKAYRQGQEQAHG